MIKVKVSKTTFQQRKKPKNDCCDYVILLYRLDLRKNGEELPSREKGSSNLKC